MAQKNFKMLPHSLEAEQSLLGCLLIDSESALNIVSTIKVSDFYTDSHQNIYDQMVRIYNSNNPIDFVTVTDALEKANSLESVGGIDYITTLTNILPSAANYKAYVDIVKRDSLLRQLISASQEIIEDCYHSDSGEDSLQRAEKSVFEIAEKEERSSLEHIAPALTQVMAKFDEIAKNKGQIRGITTGLKDFDKITNGLQNSDLILLAARPGVGKTSLAMNIINNAAIVEKKKCAVFSLEMPKVQLAQRSLCSVAKVNMEKALKGDLVMDEWKSLWAANKQLAEANVYVDDSSLNTPPDLLNKCRRLKREKGLDLVMVDYLQLMNMAQSSKSSSDSNRQQEVSAMTRYLKIAAKELNVPIILLSQLSRASETRKDHRPVPSDLRESGSIEQDADIILFIYNSSNYNDVISEDEPDVCELIVAKHRNGPTGTVKLRWVKEYTTFVDIDKKMRSAPSYQAVKTVSDDIYGGEPILENNDSIDLNEIKEIFNEKKDD